MMIEKEKKAKRFWTPKSKRKASNQPVGESKLIYISCTKEEGRFGFSLHSGWPVVVDKVCEATPAWQSGLFVGDRIMSVNGFVVEKAPASQVADMIQKISGQLDLCIERQNNAVIGNKLATFKSYLIIDEDLGNDVNPAGSKPRQSMAFTDFDCREQDGRDRKDSGTESGFLEIEAEFEDDFDRVLPDMFEMLPPLEQRRQRGITDLIKDEKNFLENLNNYVEDLKGLLAKFVFEQALSKELEIFQSKLLTVQKSLLDINMELLDRRIRYAHPSLVDNSPSFYVNAIGSPYKQKIPNTLSTLNNIVTEISLCKALAETEEDKTCKLDDVFPVLEGLISFISEYLLELQINVSHVLSCTPRKHKDHKPLREVVEDLKKHTQAIAQKRASRKATDSDMKAKDKSKNTKVKRRFSWDNSSFRVFVQLSRTLSLHTNANNSIQKETVIASSSRLPASEVSTPKNQTFPLWSPRRGEPICTQSLPRKFTMHDFRPVDIKSATFSRQLKGKDNDVPVHRDRKLGTCPQAKNVVISLQKEGDKFDQHAKVSRAKTQIVTFERSKVQRQLSVQPVRTSEKTSVRGRSKSERVENGLLVVESGGKEIKRLSRSVEDLTLQDRRRLRRRRRELEGTEDVLYLESDDDEDSILDKQIGRSLAVCNDTAENQGVRKESNERDVCNDSNAENEFDQVANHQNSCTSEGHRRLSPSPPQINHFPSIERSQSPADHSSSGRVNISSGRGCDSEISPELTVHSVCDNQLEKQEKPCIAQSATSSSGDVKNGCTENVNASAEVKTEQAETANSSVETTPKSKPLSSVSRIQQKLRERRKRHASLSDMFKAMSPSSVMAVSKNDSIDSLNSKQPRGRATGPPELHISTHFNQRVRDLLQYTSSQGASTSQVSSVDDTYLSSPQTRNSPLTSSSTGNMARFALTRDMTKHTAHGRSVSLTTSAEYNRDRLEVNGNGVREKGVVDMKVKTPGTYRRHTVSATENSALEIRRILSKKTKPSQADLKKWSEGIDCLLTDPRGLEIFRMFLRSEFSEENVLFWLACEELKQTRTYKLPIKAKKIFKTFIEVDSPYEVNIDHETRSQLEECMKTPTRTMFDQAQRRIRYLMANDSYPRFLKSILCTEVAK